MKKYYVCFLCFFGFIFIIVRVVGILGINVFSTIDKRAEEDFIHYYEYLMQYVNENNNDNIIITQETYNKSSECERIIFEDLQYQYIRINNDTVFFCKGYNGMTGIGLLYSQYYFEPNAKQKVIKQLDANWMVFAEHEL